MHIFDFVINENISRNYLCGNGVHLTESGNEFFEDNVVNFLNDFTLNVNVNGFLNWHDQVYSDEREKSNNMSDQRKLFSSYWYNKANLSDFIKVRKFYSKNPIIDYLNVNSLENKVVYFSFNKKSVKCKTN